jgi:hypothetical protein
MNSIVRVRDGGGLYGEQWNLSEARRVYIVLGDLNPRVGNYKLVITNI